MHEEVNSSTSVGIQYSIFLKLLHEKFPTIHVHIADRS